MSIHPIIGVSRTFAPSIFSGLTNREIAKTARVSKAWKESCDYTFGVDALKWGEAGVKITPKLLREQGIHSIEEVEGRIKEFFSRITFSNAGMAVVGFPFDPGCELAICVKNPQARTKKVYQGLVVASKNENRALPSAKFRVQTKYGQAFDLSILEQIDLNFLQSYRNISISVQGKIPVYDISLATVQETITKLEAAIPILSIYLKNVFDLEIYDKVNSVGSVLMEISKKLKRIQIDRNSFLQFQGLLELIERNKKTMNRPHGLEDPLSRMIATTGGRARVLNFFNLLENRLKDTLSKESISVENFLSSLCNFYYQTAAEMGADPLELMDEFFMIIAPFLRTIQEPVPKAPKSPFEQRVIILTDKMLVNMDFKGMPQALKIISTFSKRVFESGMEGMRHFMALDMQEKIFGLWSAAMVALLIASPFWEETEMNQLNQSSLGQSLWLPVCHAGELLANQCQNPFNY